MELAEMEEVLERLLDRRLTPKRARHSRGVAAFASMLCERRGLDPLRGSVAGLAHDFCKELPLEKQEALTLRFIDSMPFLARARGSVPDAPRIPGTVLFEDEAGFVAQRREGIAADALLHGPAAAVLLYEEYGLRDFDILEAVAWHTVGRPGMGELAVLVYCADKIEPGRKHVDEDFRRRCLALDPNEMLLAVVGDTVGWLERKGQPIAPETLILYNALRTTVTGT
jgi:HD superfamily phosphohydrolase YqeK